MCPPSRPKVYLEIFSPFISYIYLTIDQKEVLVKVANPHLGGNPFFFYKERNFRLTLINEFLQDHRLKV
jgi:hypothetical protein